MPDAPFTSLDRCYECQKRIGQKTWTIIEGRPVHKSCADKKIYRTLGGFEGTVSYILGAVVLELRARDWSQEDVASFIGSVRLRMTGQAPSEPPAGDVMTEDAG